MSFTTIHYTEPDQSTYEGVEVRGYDEDEPTLFNSGDFVKDWFFSRKHIIDNLADDPYHTRSSSVDHFIMDGDDYDSVYLKFDESGEPYLTNIYDYANPGMEQFIRTGEEPTWKEYVDYCKGR